jgi:hypothetical protein
MQRPISIKVGSHGNSVVRRSSLALKLLEKPIIVIPEAAIGNPVFLRNKELWIPA